MQQKDNVINVDFTKGKDQHLPVEINEELQAKRRAAIEKLPGYRGVVGSKNSIRQLPDVKAGEIFWVTMDGKAYLVAEKDKKKITIKALDETATISTGITIFDMNKGLVSKEPLFNMEDEAQLGALKERLWEWFHEDTDAQFYLLYGRDINYLTLFHAPNRAEDRLAVIQSPELDFLLESLGNVGALISMDFNTSDGETAVEIWLRTERNPAELLYLFPYDKGVVTI